MVPSEGSSSHGPPSLGRVRAPPRSPASSLLCSPPTPSPPRSRLRFPLPTTYLEAKACSSPSRPRLRERPRRRRVVTGSPWHRLLLEEEGGPPRLLGCPLRARRESATPPGAPWPFAREGSPLLLVLGHGAAVFRAEHPLDTRDDAFRGWNPHGSHARVSTHRRSRLRDRRKTRSRPAGLALWSGGIRTRWTANRVSWRHRIRSLPSDQPCLVARSAADNSAAEGR
jgi:hypothetical protein